MVMGPSFHTVLYLWCTCFKQYRHFHVLWLISICLFGESGFRWDTQKALFCPGVGSEADFEAFFSIHAGQGEQGTWSCYLCGKVTLHSGNMRQHFEAYHFRLPIGLIQCRVCAKTFKTRHSLATHMSKNHRDANRYWWEKRAIVFKGGLQK